MRVHPAPFFIMLALFLGEAAVAIAATQSAERAREQTRHALDLLDKNTQAFAELKRANDMNVKTANSCMTDLRRLATAF